MERRNYLRAAAAAGVIALAGCPSRQPDEPEEPTPTPREEPTPSPREERPPEDELADRFDHEVDLVDEGADPTGEERINAILEEALADDTLVRLPEGEYLIGRVSVEDLSNVGVIGDEATLVLDEPGRGVFLSMQRSQDVLIDGLVVDSTAENTAAWLDLRVVGGENVLRDYRVEGFGDVGARTNGLTVLVEGSDTELLVDRARLPDGAENGAATFAFSRSSFDDPDREGGTLTFRDCVMRGWGKEGLYASAHPGPLNVIGGEYANNAIVQVRGGGGDAPNGVLISGVTAIVDEVPSYTPPYNRTYRGIWLKEGDIGTVRNCTVEIGDIDGGVDGGIVVHRHFGRATIEDCTIRNAANAPGLSLRTPVDSFQPDSMPSMSDLPADWWVRVRNVTVEGSAPGTEAVYLSGRDGCLFENLAVDHTGDDGDGMVIQRADRCVLSGGRLIADRHPLVIEVSGNPRNVTLTDVEAIESRSRGENGTHVATSIDGQFHLRADRLTDEGAIALTEQNANRLYGRPIDDEVFV